MQLLKKSAFRLFSQDCLLCGGGTDAAHVCRACEGTLPRWTFADGGVAAFEYRFPVDRLVQRFKFAGDLATGNWLGMSLAERVSVEPRPDLLVAPPLTAARLKTRGFNQALELGKVLARRHRLRLEWRGIERSRESPSQAGLGRQARKLNLEGAFHCHLRLGGMKVAIVDDVFTTGATSTALANALRQAGAAEVCVWTVARTPPPGRL